MDYYRNEDKWNYKDGLTSISGTQYRVVTDMIDEPISVDLFKEHIRVDFDTDDNLIDKYLKASRKFLEQWSMLSFGVKTVSFMAVGIPKNYKLMYGPVDSIITEGFTNFGDVLKEGGNDIEITYTTLDTLSEDESIQIAICRYAAGLYIFRENINETKYNYKTEMDEAQKMLAPYRNIILF